jgi:hypothetical protein
MITNYAKIDMMRLLLLSLLIVMPLFLMLSSILTMASATSNIGAIPEIVSDVTSGEIAPVLLAPMATSGNNVYVVWPSNQTGILDIVFRASSDNGQTFTDKVNLSNTPNVDSIDPEITASGNNVYISWWEDYGNGTRVPFFKASNDNGVTFSSVLSLSDNGPLPVQNTNTNTNTNTNNNNNINNIY